MTSRAVLAAGDTVLIIDKKGRRYLKTLVPSAEFHTHTGVTSHDSFIGQVDGATVVSPAGASYVVIRPTLSDMVVKMPRGAQVIYPKDIGPIMTLADIYPGVRVLEAGVGSGGLSMGLVRAGAIVKGYELREDFAQIARDNVARFCGDSANNFDVEIRDIYDGIDEVELDAIVLDLPEPWNVVKHAESALRGGGMLVSYVPSTTQVQQLRRALDDSRFGLIKTIEVMERGWYIKDEAVRPDHRMVAHTGFLTVGRLLADAASPPNEKMPFVRA